MKNKMNNKGFSLVELIIVIAIMAVLVGILAPQFIKYVGQSKRATDVQNAQSIATAILTDIASGDWTATSGSIGTDNCPTTMENNIPEVQGTTGATFDFTADISAGKVTITIDGAEVYPSASKAKLYKDGKSE